MLVFKHNVLFNTKNVSNPFDKEKYFQKCTSSKTYFICVFFKTNKLKDHVNFILCYLFDELVNVKSEMSKLYFSLFFKFIYYEIFAILILQFSNTTIFYLLYLPHLIEKNHD